ncbi:MAG: hypothetical protein AB1921_14325 [Thermodesulfobacteriota bacterium]
MKTPYIDNMDSIRAYRLERLFILVIEDVGLEKGMNFSQIARAAWPEMPDPVRYLRELRRQSTAGKPKQLSVRDAALLAAAVGHNMSEITFKAEQHLKTGTKPNSFMEGEAAYGVGSGDDELSEVAEKPRAYGSRKRKK